MLRLIVVFSIVNLSTDGWRRAGFYTRQLGRFVRSRSFRALECTAPRAGEAHRNLPKFLAHSDSPCRICVQLSAHARPFAMAVRIEFRRMNFLESSFRRFPVASGKATKRSCQLQVCNQHVETPTSLQHHMRDSRVSHHNKWDWLWMSSPFVTRKVHRGVEATPLPPQR